jgi:hypothetical protein
VICLRSCQFRSLVETRGRNGVHEVHVVFVFFGGRGGGAFLTPPLGVPMVFGGGGAGPLLVGAFFKLNGGPLDFATGLNSGALPVVVPDV